MKATFVCHESFTTVTGAVNIITKKEIDETTVSVKKGLSDRNDADEFQASLSTGFNFAGGRGRVAVGGTYTKTNPLFNLYNYRQHYYAYEPNFWLADEQKRYRLCDGRGADRRGD